MKEWRLAADTARKRPERRWTAARTMEVLRQCPLAVAQWLVHCAIAVSTAVLGRVTSTMLHCCWGRTRSKRSPTFAAQLHLPTHDLFWANLKVQLYLPPLDLLISPGTLIVLAASIYTESFPWLWHVCDSTSALFENKCWTLSHAILGFPLFVVVVLFLQQVHWICEDDGMFVLSPLKAV